jgi:transposase
MGRRTIEFTEVENFSLTQMVEAGKNYDEITDMFEKAFRKVSRSTIVKQIKSLGLEMKDNRINNTKIFKSGFEGFDDTQKRVIQLYWGLGDTLDEIVERLKDEFKIEVSRTSIRNLITKEGYVQGKRYEPTYGDTDFGDEEEFEEQVKINMEKKSEREYPEELIKKMSKDENLVRLGWYQEGRDYNYDGQEGTEREGAKDTWFNRDGFLKINVTPVIHFSRDYMEYETEGGKYRCEFEWRQDMRFYTFSEGKDGRGAEAEAKRIEICNWYKKHRWMINNLYDAIVAKNYSNCDEVKEFNKLCRELYEKKMEFAEVLRGKNSKTMMIMRGQSMDSSFEDFKKYMREATKDEEMWK